MVFSETILYSIGIYSQPLSLAFDWLIHNKGNVNIIFLKSSTSLSRNLESISVYGFLEIEAKVKQACKVTYLRIPTTVTVMLPGP